MCLAVRVIKQIKQDSAEIIRLLNNKEISEDVVDYIKSFIRILE